MPQYMCACMWLHGRLFFQGESESLSRPKVRKKLNEDLLHNYFLAGASSVLPYIIGGSVGGGVLIVLLVLVIVILALCLCARAKRQNKTPQHSTTASRYIATSNSLERAST